MVVNVVGEDDLWMELMCHPCNSYETVKTAQQDASATH